MTTTYHLRVSFPSLQEKSAEDFPWHWPHGLSELGPGPVSVHRLDHVLLLHLEGGEIHRKGGWEGVKNLTLIICLFCFTLTHLGWHLVFISSFCRVSCLHIYHHCVYIGGLLHCDLPLSDADCAVDPRAHPAWCWDRYQVLPLSRPGTTGGPTGTTMSRRQLQIKAKKCGESFDWCRIYHGGVIPFKQFKQKHPSTENQPRV